MNVGYANFCRLVPEIGYHSDHEKNVGLTMLIHMRSCRVAQNKPDDLLLLFKFCICTRKHVSMIMYV